jgi:hypothetical protein
MKGRLAAVMAAVSLVLAVGLSQPASAGDDPPPQPPPPSFPLTIITGGLTCTNGVCALGPANVGTFFFQAISQSGGQGSPPFNWSLVAGALPDGLTLNDPRQCGVHCVSITGTPTTVQTTTFTIQVQDGVGATAQQDFSLTINPPRPLVITSANPCCRPGTVGAFYIVNFFADGVCSRTPGRSSRDRFRRVSVSLHRHRQGSPAPRRRRERSRSRWQ